MSIFADLLAKSIDLVVAEASALTKLDQATGDGDYGVNMKRGFTALQKQSDKLTSLPLAKGLQQTGMTIMKEVGGSSGPLVGSFFITLGKELVTAEMPESPTLDELARAYHEGVETIKRRGKSDVGQKTMLDTLIPVDVAFQKAIEGNLPAAEVRTLLSDTAWRGMEATKDMQAEKGRASFLGKRSMGHVDPGARLSYLLIDLVCSHLEIATSPA